jgi:radical S-adenosyl methionine domain-containing protein 2
MLGKMCKYAKELGINVSIVSNGSKIDKSWMKKYGKYVDILAISVDSFDEATNIGIGRGKGKHVLKLHDVAKWCVEQGIKFKINTVVNSLNVDEDLSYQIKALKPARWKVFQVLIVKGENDGEAYVDRGRVSKLLIAEFLAYLDVIGSLVFVRTYTDRFETHANLK